MDPLTASALRLAPAALCWPGQDRERRRGERRAERVQAVLVEPIEAARPSAAFLAQVLGQGVGAAPASAYHTAPRYACGVCSDRVA